MKLVQTRLIIMNFLIFAVWGAYLCSLGIYLNRVHMGNEIGQFFGVQGIVSLFMPTLAGIIADRWVPTQKLLGLCQLLASIFMGLAGYMGMKYGDDVKFIHLFPFYVISVAFFMPSMSLGISVSYFCLTESSLDPIKYFPSIRVFGTIGFIISMWIVNFTAKNTYVQLFISAGWGIILTFYCLTLPNCKINKKKENDEEKNKKTSLIDAFGLRAFALFKERNMCIFFIFSFCLGMCLQITNGFATPYIDEFSPKYGDTFAVKNNLFLLSISQISEMICMPLIPFFLKRFGIKNIIIISFVSWGLRFILLGLGSPTGFGLVLFILSMLIYGIAFDFYNISGSLYIEENTNENIRSSAQGVYMMMTSGFGSTIGSYCAQAIINICTHNKKDNYEENIRGWSLSWYIFGGFALVAGLIFIILFRYKHNPKPSEQLKQEEEKLKQIENLKQLEESSDISEQTKHESDITDQTKQLEGLSDISEQTKQIDESDISVQTKQLDKLEQSKATQEGKTQNIEISIE